MKFLTITGTEDLRLVFEKTLHNREKMLRTVLSDQPLVYFLGKAFAEKYMQERKKQGIFLRSLRTLVTPIDLPDHRDHSKWYKEVRNAPLGIKFSQSLILWDDFVAIVNPKDLSGVLIQNENNANLLKEWFDFIWLQSK